MLRYSPYIRLMRLHQPTGIWLLLLPCWWSVTLASPAFPAVKLLLFTVGAVAMRAAGCIVNDLTDRKLDAKVERTKHRPLASGEIRPLQAIRVLLALLIVGLSVALSLGKQVVIGSLLSLPLIAIYPWMKRITWWPQLFLGLTFNWGALLGWLAARGHIEAPALWLYVGGVFWTLGYDTIYAHQDKTDDALAGIKSTARHLGARTKPALRIFYIVAFICWAYAAKNIIACAFLAPGLLYALWRIQKIDLDNPAECRRAFAANSWIAGSVWIAFIFGKLGG